MTAATLSIDRLALHVPAMSEHDAETLAHEVARALRLWPATPGVSGRLTTVKAEVAPRGGGDRSNDLPRLAEQIAASICAAATRELGR
jgi:hypothetical protein